MRRRVKQSLHKDKADLYIGHGVKPDEPQKNWEPAIEEVKKDNASLANTKSNDMRIEEIHNCMRDKQK